jgi:hypothetical protein
MKGFKNLSTAVLAILILFAFRTVSCADDGVIGRTPEGVYSMTDSEVEMESEEISIDLEQSTAECVFVFHNTGKARTVLMGFPGKLDKSRGSELTPEANLSLHDFKTYVKGKSLPVRKEKEVKGSLDLPFYEEWFTFEVPFKAGERITVRNTYSFTPSHVSTGDVFTGYVLQTGSTWKGTIGNARVIFKLGSIKPWEIVALGPGGYRFEGNGILWEGRDIEPSYDLSLTYNTWHYSKDFLDLFDPNGEENKSAQAKIDSFKKIESLADQKDQEKLLSEYSNAVEAGDSVLAAYIAGFLPEGSIKEEIPLIGDIDVMDEGSISYVICDINMPYALSVNLKITHKEDGKTICDGEWNTPSCDFTFTPGLRYNISVIAADWLNRSVEKEIEYSAPEKESPGVTEQISTGKIETADNHNETAVNMTEAGVSMTESGGRMNFLWVLFPLLFLVCTATGAVLYKKHTG